MTTAFEARKNAQTQTLLNQKRKHFLEANRSINIKKGDRIHNNIKIFLN